MNFIVPACVLLLALLFGIAIDILPARMPNMQRDAAGLCTIVCGQIGCGLWHGAPYQTGDDIRLGIHPGSPIARARIDPSVFACYVQTL
jgi:hypothetical protein